MFHVPGNGFIEAGELDEFLMALGRESNKVCRHFFFQAAEVNLAIPAQLLVSSEEAKWLLSGEIISVFQIG